MGDVRFDFFKFLGIQPDEVRKSMVFESSRNNDALSAEAIFIADAIRKANPIQDMSDAQFVEKYEQLLLAIKGEKLKLTRDQADEVIRAAQVHTKYLFDEFGIGFASPIKQEGSTSPEFGPQTIRSLANLIHQLSECKLAMASLPSIQEDNAAKNIDSSQLLIKNIGPCAGSDVHCGQLVSFEVDIQLARSIKDLEMGIRVFDAERKCVFVTSTRMLGRSHVDVPTGAYRVIYHMIANLTAGDYSLGVSFTERLAEGEMLLAEAEGLGAFHVSSQDENMFNGYMHIPAEITLLPASTRIDNHKNL